MDIVIIGAGFTGVQLAKRLISEKNEVVLVEKYLKKEKVSALKHSKSYMYI